MKIVKTKMEFYMIYVKYLNSLLNIYYTVI